MSRDLAPELHPIARDAAGAFVESSSGEVRFLEEGAAALRTAILGLAQSPELTYALQSLVVLAQRLLQAGAGVAARALLEIASTGAKPLADQNAQSSTRKLASAASAFNRLSDTKTLDLKDGQKTDGTPSWKLECVASIPRRA